MKILLYAAHAAPGSPGEKLENSILKAFPAEMIETYRTIKDLSRRLHQPKHDLAVAVLAADSKEEFSAIVSLAHLLNYLRIILILPDREKDTIARGHTLRPRFLSYMDADPGEVAAVLCKMAGESPQT